MKLEKKQEYIYYLKKQDKMKVPVIVYSSEELLKSIKKDKTLEQIKNVACLPGIVGYACAMPDAHQGYGFPIGSVAAFDAEKGIISPAGVGYDINCSVRLLKTNLKKEDLIKKQKEITELIYKKIPSGVGRGSNFNLSRKDFNELLREGAQFIVKKGLGFIEDYKNTEESGKLEKANPDSVSEKAIKRGIGQLGTLGSGNHFLEIGFVEDIYEKEIADIFGLEKNNITIMIHCGSRGLGHQIATDYIEKIKKTLEYENFPDKELAYAPITSQIGKDYFSAMACATNFAFANKQLITHWLREVFIKIFPDIKIDVVYDVCHNIAKFEKHIIEGKQKQVLVHRKGATRSFGPEKEEIPEKYRKTGQPVIIPGSMGTSSYVLVGTKESEKISFGSTVHGAGRIKSRSEGIKKFRGKEIQEKLKTKGIEVISRKISDLSEEAPEVYKDVDEVIKVVEGIGISKKIARLKPLIVLK